MFQLSREGTFQKIFVLCMLEKLCSIFANTLKKCFYRCFIGKICELKFATVNLIHFQFANEDISFLSHYKPSPTKKGTFIPFQIYRSGSRPLTSYLRDEGKASSSVTSRVDVG